MKPTTARRFLFATLIAACCTTANAQNIYTFAGNGTPTPGYSGDGGYANSALLWEPAGVATHDYEKVYIADQANHVVRLVNYNGIIATYAGNGTAGNTGNGVAADSCELYYPCAVALDWSANLIIADYYSNVVRRVNVTTGVVTTIAGTGGNGYTGDGGPATLAELSYPYGVAVDPSGNIYVADAGNNVIRVITAFGVIQTVAGNGVGYGLGIGHGGYSGDGGNALNAELNYPCGIAVDNGGNIYIADAANSAIRKVGVNDTITTIAGTGYPGFSGDGGSSAGARLNFPSGIALDGMNQLYIADQANNRIRLINTAGVISTFAGIGSAGYYGDGGPATLAQLNTPKGVVVDANNLVYVADAANNAVRVIGNYHPNAVAQVTATDNAMKVFPNPAAGIATVQFSQPGITTLSVMDMLGRTAACFTVDASAASTLIDCSALPAGNYIVKATTATGAVVGKAYLVRE